MDDLDLFKRITTNLLNCRLAPEDFAVFLDSANDLLNVSSFKTLSEFVTTSVNRNGLGLTIEEANVLLSMNKSRRDLVETLSQKLTLAERAKEINKVAEQGKSTHSTKPLKNKTIVDNSKNVNYSLGGNDSSYRIGKLKRDHPEVAERLCNGEFKNVREAERAAGVQPAKKRLKRFSIDLDDLEGSRVEVNKLIDELILNES